MRRSAQLGALIAAILFSFLILGFEWDGRLGLMITTVVSLSIILAAFFFSSLPFGHMFGGRPLEGPDGWGLTTKLESLALRAKMPVPQLVIVSLPVPISFSSSNCWRRGTIFVSQSMVELLTPSEWEAVLAFELARIRHQDPLAVRTVTAATRAITWLPRKLAPRLLWALTPVARMILSLAVKPHDFLIADQKAAELIGSSRRVAEVLWKLNSHVQTQPLEIEPPITHFFIVDPMGHKGRRRGLCRQPEISLRMEKLLGSFPV